MVKYKSRLVPVSFSRKHNGVRYWWCKCACGNLVERSITNVRSGATKSCGCLKSSLKGKRCGSYKHGMTESPTYRSWYAMLARCRRHPRYKGRISVCKRWDNPVTGFQNFLADMGERPEGCSLERKKNHLGYSPKNCVWATPAEQNRNTRANVLITWEGRTMCAADWAKELGISPKTLRARVSRGNPTERVLKELTGATS